MKKRILSITLALMMVLALLPFGALAAEDYDLSPYAEVLEPLGADVYGTYFDLDGDQSPELILTQGDSESFVLNIYTLADGAAVRIFNQGMVVGPTVEPTAAPNKSTGADKKAAAPVSGQVVWGYAADKLIYSKTLDQWTTHKAVDIACPQGTAVKCVLGGTVERVYTDDQLGVTVIVKHSSDRKTLYANLNETVPVRAGDKVNAGTVLGTVGKTAISECAQESHLHFAFFVKGKAVDPTTKVKIG